MNFFVAAPSVAPKPTPALEKIGESSRSIRNIPKKQRVSEIYTKPEPAKVDSPKPESDTVMEDSPEVKKAPKGGKRKHAASKAATEPLLPLNADTDDSLFKATAELLNVTAVPKEDQLPSTFRILNDVDKRLPPKERNKRIMRDKEASVSNNGTSKESPKEAIESPIQNELMLPHKKKKSSRVLTPDKLTLQRESRGSRQETSGNELRNRKKRKSTEPDEEQNSTPKPLIADEETPPKAQSPLREDTCCVNASNSAPESRRALKRHITDDSERPKLDNSDASPATKRLCEVEEPDALPKMFVACASEALVINSKGQMSVARRDSLVTTQANTVMVTSNVILTEATHQPIASSAPSAEQVSAPKPPIISATIKIPTQSLKNAVKFPAEKLLEMKKQGLVTTGIDMKNKWTEKGKIVFKEQIKTALDGGEEKAKEPEQVKTPESEPKQKIAGEAAKVDSESAETPIEAAVETPPQAHQDDAAADVANECTNNNDVEKDQNATVPSSPAKETQAEEPPTENGKDAEADPEVQTEDVNNSGAGLIALQAESFGGPPNCFYLCRQNGDRYEPVDNQILVLDAQNALVPYEGDIASDDAMAPNDIGADNVASHPQLSPNSNIIINTPNGQKIELDHFTILALHEQADENGIASIELSGEQLELNINGILEAISQQHEANENEALLPSPMLIDGENTLILDTAELTEPIIHHSATQVSETLSKPIMSTTIAPEISSVKATVAETVVAKNLNIDDSLATIGVTTQPTRSNVPKSLELPITVTNPTIAGKI